MDPSDISGNSQMPTGRKTKKPIRVKISNKRMSEIDELIDSWTFETKEFMLQRLNQYKPRLTSPQRIARNLFYWLNDTDPSLKFKNLKNPEILTNWRERFQQSGEENPASAWNSILKKEVSYNDKKYMFHRIKEKIEDTFLPAEIADIFDKIYKTYIRKEFTDDPNLPKAPIVLVTGCSGSGKSATVQKAVESVIFQNVLKPERDYKKEVDKILANYPIWTSLEDVNPELAEEIEQAKRVKSLKRRLKIPIYRKFMSKKINKELLDFEEQGIRISYKIVTPNDYNTAWAGEPGNFLKRAMGNPNSASIRHLEEAHSACGKKDGRTDSSHEKTLTDTMNIILDEIANGKRDCLVLMTTDQSDKFDSAIYRRIVEKGKIIDMSKFWEESHNLEEVVKMELNRHNIMVKDSDQEYTGKFQTLNSKELENTVQKIYPLFESRNLNITPAYVRKLVGSIIKIKKDFHESYLDEKIVVREAFKNVAKNIHGEMYKKVVGKIPREVKWSDYIGNIKGEFSKLANNCLLYNISEEKGAVLAGPPGSGKTFLAQAWLGEHPEVTDILLNLNVLQDPNNPYDTTAVVDNLEKLFDIAKMVAPSFVYGDEGDALAPKRTHGENQSDKITNKLLSIIGGEKPLYGVFTTLSTNRLDIMDPALVRSKRLKTMSITGHLREQDIYNIIEKHISNLPKKDDITNDAIYKSAKMICNTPADYTSFVEEMKNLQKTEFEVIQNIKKEKISEKDELGKFISFNHVSLRGIVENIDLPLDLKNQIKKSSVAIIENFDEIYSALKNINSIEEYPLTKNHIDTVKIDMARNPTKRGVQQLGDFIQTQLPEEPQIGFVVGVGVMDNTLGILLPIGTSLSYKTSKNKINITGATKPSGGVGTAEIEMAVEMMKQSAQEALILVQNYIQTLCPKMNISKLFGDFLEDHTINHQLLTAQYMGGGPSAGFALTINTLSEILQIPVFNDFGITGAPWTKGVTKENVGSSVIIGGQAKKTEKVLQELDRMYMPQKNYEEMELDFLTSYWDENKDVMGVKNFRSLAPEVLCLDEKHAEQVSELIQKRIDYKKDVFVHYSKDAEVMAQKEEEITALEKKIKTYAETEIIRRVDCIKTYLGKKVSNEKYQSLEEIFRTVNNVKKLSYPTL